MTAATARLTSGEACWLIVRVVLAAPFFIIGQAVLFIGCKLLPEASKTDPSADP